MYQREGQPLNLRRALGLVFYRYPRFPALYLRVSPREAAEHKVVLSPRVHDSFLLNDVNLIVLVFFLLLGRSTQSKQFWRERVYFGAQLKAIVPHSREIIAVAVSGDVSHASFYRNRRTIMRCRTVLSLLSLVTPGATLILHGLTPSAQL